MLGLFGPKRDGAECNGKRKLQKGENYFSNALRIERGLKAYSGIINMGPN